MTKNLGNVERMLRGLGGAGAAASAALLPLEPAFRIGLGATAAMLWLTALSGTCLGYRLMGKSTCPRSERA